MSLANLKEGLEALPYDLLTCIAGVESAFTAGILQDENIKAHATSLHPFRGLGSPGDIAPVAVFLASEDAKWVTGHGVVVDGGYTAQ